MSRSRYYFAEDWNHDQKTPETDLEDSFKRLNIHPEVKKEANPEIKLISQFLSPKEVEAERMMINLEFIKSQLPKYIESLNKRLDDSMAHYQSILDKRKR